ncbi:HAMP domain-containing histidine kinase [Paenibacillus donghaensis]|uniref:sensor histidine kinase n=1 Tax=Paenibacillus donghaensis TaxID=414771 RepID=UPI0018848C15|nr:HAMP domain-containing sensor histidine kinase [Paenibacillus donghaensis]MBE9913860.1 HAMP domain-containing histidine kinase [Paenibacillus donghaensis]
MRSFFNKLQWKIILLFFLSVGLAVGTFSLLIPLLSAIYDRYPTFRYATKLHTIRYGLFRINEIASFPVWQAVMVAFLFIFYVLLLSWGTTRKLTSIFKGVKRMEEGNMDERIRVRSNDEIGMLADQINTMAERLQISLQEERMATQAKNELITNVSHDLRTPLTSIIGYLRLIEEDKYKDEVELRYYVNIAYEKSKRMNRLVSDLFDYTRMGFGQIPLNKTSIDLVQLSGQLTAEFTLQLKNHQMEIELFPPQDKLWIYGDGDKIMQAFENLITNAMRYGKEGKKIHVHVAKENEEAVVRVVNFGPPIPSMELPYIFDRFYRVEKSRSLDTGGAGLGLAIVKSIIELHDGSITATSSPQQTEFIVRLPLSEVKQ